MYHRGEAELHGFPEKSLDLVVDSPFWPVIYTRHHFPETTESSTGASVDYQMQTGQRRPPIHTRGFEDVFFQHAEIGPLRCSHPPLKHLDA